ncbi:NUDIX hydrolase [Prosthecobacter sp.]|uniref:NUDIX domain-containing protein n=1 Tax=Prosthecobacter sp. TaxID=1965333 RepID=UPI00248781E2|nr:NUDIX hydrolase [Prosthecobacter sp.]MDI1311767.1 NUDIX hydrolase [Prosthecobacter sp.]
MPTLPQHPNPWQTVSSRETYANPWIRVREDQVIKPTGGAGIYGVVEYKNIAVGVIPVDAEGYTWLVGQWRYCHGRYEWEIPEGGCPAGESTVEAARRELKEETGIVAATIVSLLSGIQLSNSTSNEVCDIFIATGLTHTAAQPEDTEELEVLRLPLSEAIQMARDGRIRDSVSVLALLAVAGRGGLTA